MIEKILVKTSRQKQVIDLTSQVNAILKKAKHNHGIYTIFVSHTTAGLTTGEMGEGTDQDLLEVMEKIIPKISFRHAHNPSHAWTHMASSLTGVSLTIPFESKHLILGTWQSVLFLEFDGPRKRSVIVTVHE